MSAALSEDLYVRLFNEEDARVCREISEEACVEVPRNFFLQVGSSFLTQLGDATANAKTTLPWQSSSRGEGQDTRGRVWQSC